MFGLGYSNFRLTVSIDFPFFEQSTEHVNEYGI